MTIRVILIIFILVSVFVSWLIYLIKVKPCLKENGIIPFTDTEAWLWVVNSIRDLIRYKHLCNDGKASVAWFYLAVCFHFLSISSVLVGVARILLH